MIPLRDDNPTTIAPIVTFIVACVLVFLWQVSQGADGFGRILYSLGVVPIAQALANPSSEVPMIGASGAISGVLGAYLFLYPRAQVLVLLPMGVFSQTIQLPALGVLGFWFVFQILNSATAGEAQSGVAWLAHIGGFIPGMALIPFFKYRTPRACAARCPRRLSCIGVCRRT